MDDMEKKESVESEASEKATEEVAEEKAADKAVEASTETPKDAHVDEEGILEYDDSNASKFDKFFGVTKFGSSIRTEIIAGLVTFLAMCYILVVNPDNLVGGGSPLWASVFIATAFGAIIGTLLMALFAKMPFAQAPGLGLNSMLFTLIAGYLVTGKEYSFGAAMLLVLISGVFFLIVSLVPIKKDKDSGKWITLRELIFDGMPATIRKGISVGIGLFIAFIGLQKGLIVDSPYTLVDLVPFNNPDAGALGGICCNAIVILFGLFVITILSHFKVKGAIIIGILAATLLAWPLQVTSIDRLTEGNWAFWENFANYFKGVEDGGVFLAAFRNVEFPAGSFMSSLMVVITFSMIDMFDTMGTVVACATNAGLVDKDGKPHNYNKIMISDSVATVCGALLGTSTVTTFVESGSGIAAGGKTGLTSLTVACLFFLAIFILPIFQFIPSAACAPALIYVGVLMMANVKDIEFKDPLLAVPAFITIVFMPLTYSITDGIGWGILSYVILQSIAYCVKFILYKAGKAEEAPKWNISIVCLVVAVLFLVYFFVPMNF